MAYEETMPRYDAVQRSPTLTVMVELIWQCPRMAGRAVSNRNRRNEPGLLVHLAGPVNSPTAVGAILWLSSSAGRGPRQEV
ncbi:MAG: hypothetical protein M2R45_04295 [Verrucomicrobia subdivision 3 bacterium]|nr:hypothetical protein [Limisphaerales bacterium]MCS1417210.1 hypothetical protein [Limisphaerales bacterium]